MRDEIISVANQNQASHFVLQFHRKPSRSNEELVLFGGNLDCRLSILQIYSRLGSTPSASKAFQPQRCGLISITVIGHQHESIRDKTLRLTPHVQVQQTQSAFPRTHNEPLSVARCASALRINAASTSIATE